MVLNAETNESLGYKVETLLDGKYMGHKDMKPEHFQSRKYYHAFCLAQSGIMQGDDKQVAAVSECLREMAMKADKVTYALFREGLDFIQRPGVRDGTLDGVWVAADKIETFGMTPFKYVFRPMYGGFSEGTYKADLMDAPDLVVDDAFLATMRALFAMNNKRFVMATLLGWFVSTFQRTIYRRFWNQFPLCHVFGQAGAGKTETVRALLRLFYMHNRPSVVFCDTTFYAMSRSAMFSSSIPLVLEEYKPRTFQAAKREGLLAMFKSSYNEGKVLRGGGTGEVGSSWMHLQELSYTAPIMFIGEGFETESAVQERSVIVPMSKSGLQGREVEHQIVSDNGVHLSAIGKVIVRSIIQSAADPERLQAFKAQVEANDAKAKAVAFRRNNHRMVFNMAVVLTGLDYLEQLLDGLGVNGRLAEEFEQAREAVLDLNNQTAVVVQSEPAKVLNYLAFISQTEDTAGDLGLRHGVDYHYRSPNELDIAVRNCYITYVAWCRQKGQTPLYDNEEACLRGLGIYAAVTDKVCADSPIKTSPQAFVYRLNVKLLEEEGVEPFRGAT
jgi:hypothetical protein